MPYVVCVQSGEEPFRLTKGGGITFSFQIISQDWIRLDIALFLCVCWLDKVVLLVHCCVLQISCLQRHYTRPSIIQNTSFFAISTMDVDVMVISGLGSG